MAGIDWVCDVSASRLKGQQVNNKLRQVRRANHGQRERLVAGRVRDGVVNVVPEDRRLIRRGPPR
jgi:hypothetical protein